MGPEEGSYWILSHCWQPFWGKSCMLHYWVCWTVWSWEKCEKKINLYLYNFLNLNLALIQLSWTTSDNASNNNTTMKALGEQLVSVDPGTGEWRPQYTDSVSQCILQKIISNIYIYIYISCVAHMIHLATKKCSTQYTLPHLKVTKQEVTTMRARSHRKPVIYLAKSWH